MTNSVYSAEKENELEKFLSHSDTYEKRQKSASGSTRIPPFLGEPDGSDEWETDLDSEKTFIHTHSYDEISAPETLFIFGRRGTGKSAALRMLRHEIRKGDFKGNYDYCWLISEPDSYSELTQIYRDYQHVGINNNELENNNFRRIWRWVLKVAAIRAVLVADQSNFFEESDKSFEVIRGLFEEVGFIENSKCTSKPTVRYAADVIAKCIEACQVNGLQPGISLRKAVNELNSSRWTRAFDIIRKFLSSREERVLVLVDSVEEYQLHDPIARANVSGLVQAVSRTYSKSRTGNFVAKLAMPSEIHERIDFGGRLKQGGRKVFISWRHSDLVIAIAKRVKRYELKDLDQKKIFRQLEEIKSYAKAVRVLREWVPETIKTEQGIEANTLYYILKHTQKRPRQVLIIFNNILALAHNGKGFNINEQTIRDGVHGIGYEIMRDALENYERIYPEALDLANSTFVREPFVFRYSLLSKKMNAAKPIRARAELTEEQVARFFTESGIIGRVKKSWLEESLLHLEAEFEYQLPGPVSFKGSDFAVIHPLFYEGFGSLIYKNVLIHPVITDDEEKLTRDQ